MCNAHRRRITYGRCESTYRPLGKRSCWPVPSPRRRSGFNQQRPGLGIGIEPPALLNADGLYVEAFERSEDFQPAPRWRSSGRKPAGGATKLRVSGRGNKQAPRAELELGFAQAIAGNTRLRLGCCSDARCSRSVGVTWPLDRPRDNAPRVPCGFPVWSSIWNTNPRQGPSRRGRPNASKRYRLSYPQDTIHRQTLIAIAW